MSYFFPRSRRGRSESIPAVPAGYRVYAIGDIHGRLDLLDALLERIDTDDRSRPPAETVLIFLGDLIDRGPASSGVIERLRTFSRPSTRPVFLSGNHEEVLLRLLRGESQFLGDWLRFGGAECAASYGLDAAAIKRMEPASAARLLGKAIPSVHRSFLEGFVDTFQIGDYLFVHAGIRPGVELAEQTQTDLRWIRNPFLHNDFDHGFVVVHGHTICEEVQVRPNRIGLDTGAYRTGILSALALEGKERWFLQTEAASAAVPMASSPRLALGGNVG